MIRSVFQYHRVAVQSGHSLSKDWTGGIIVLLWLLKFYPHAKVICTGPADRQVKEIVFGEIRKQYAQLRQTCPEFPEDALKTNKLEFGPDCYALGFTTKESKELVGKFQGFKSPNLLILITEAQAVDHFIYKQMRGIMTSDNSRVIELGNPLVCFGDYYEHCTNPRYNYKVIQMSCFESPNVIAGKEIIPGMVTKKFIEDAQSDIGPDYETDPEYQARVLGQFPQNSNQAWIPLEKIKAAAGREFPASQEDLLMVGGLDAAREGDDETVHTVLKGRTQVRQDCFKKVLTPETVGWARSLIEGAQLDSFAIDIGYNPGILDWLQFEKISCMGINFGEAPPNERFADMGTYIWYVMRQAFLHDEISILEDPILISQLASRKVEVTPKGKIKLESKKKIKKSPDRADALALAWFARTMLAGGVPIEDSDMHTASSRLETEIDRPAARARESDPESESFNVISDSSLEASELPD